MKIKSPVRPTHGSAAAETETPRRAHTRQVLLDAAAKLFAERGYHDTTVPNIVRAAGVSQGTFYQYFENRRDVLIALTEVAKDPYRGLASRRASNFEDFMREEINWYLIEGTRFTILFKVWHDAAAHDPEIASLVRQAQGERAKQLAARIGTIETAAGLILEIAAIAIVAMIDEFTFRWLVDYEGAPRTTAEVLAASETLNRLVSQALGLQAGATPQD